MAVTEGRGAGVMPLATSEAKGCSCALCQTVTGLEQVQAGLDALIDDGDNRDGHFYFLRDEVARIASSPLAFLVRGRLRRALRLATPWTERQR